MKRSGLVALGALMFLSACAQGQDPWSSVKDHFRKVNESEGTLTNTDPAVVTKPLTLGGGAKTAAASSASPATVASPSPSPSTLPTSTKTSASSAYAYCAACLLDATGKMIAEGDKLVGDLEKVGPAGGDVMFEGWAADTGAGVPASTVLLVSNGKVVASAQPNQPRPDVSAHLKLVKNIQFGYQLRLPMADLGADAWVWMIGTDGKARRIDKQFRR